MRIVFISDTHNKHAEMDLPAGDLLIHAGDLSGRGRRGEVQHFMDWFGSLPHPHKVLIAGNHDFLAEDHPDVFLEMVPDNVHYLNDSEVTVAGLRIWGSPITPWFHDWAFNRHRGAEIRPHWDPIPEGIDILVTHGPPYGVLDATTRKERVGCVDLLTKIKEVKPRIHVFGHIHEAWGYEQSPDTLYINASKLDVNYAHRAETMVVDWETSDKKPALKLSVL